MNLQKEELYRLIDKLPENKIKKVKQYLEKLLIKKTTEMQWAELLANPVYDDEPWTEEDEKDLQEALQDIANGRVKPFEQYEKDLKV